MSAELQYAALWCGLAMLFPMVVAALVVWSALIAASRDDDLLDRTKTFRQLFRESGSNNEVDNEADND